MPPHKRLGSVCHSLAHHACSQLCSVHPHLSEALRVLGVAFMTVDLTQKNLCPAALKSHPYLSSGLDALQARFVEILESEGFTLSSLQAATVRFHFDQSGCIDYCSECHAKLITLDGREYMAAVNYLGKSIVAQFE